MSPKNKNYSSVLRLKRTKMIQHEPNQIKNIFIIILITIFILFILSCNFILLSLKSQFTFSSLKPLPIHYRFFPSPTSTVHSSLSDLSRCLHHQRLCSKFSFTTDVSTSQISHHQYHPPCSPLIYNTRQIFDSFKLFFFLTYIDFPLQQLNDPTQLKL